MKPEVALIYPYFRTFADIQQLFQPLGIACLGAEIKNLGIQVIQYDCTFEKYDEVIDSIVRQNPGIVGIYTMITLSRNTFKMLTSLQEKLPHSLFVSGGPLPTLYPDRFAKEFDIVFRGESDISFPMFCKDYLENPLKERFLKIMALNKYPGIYISGNGKKVDVPPRHLTEGEVRGLQIADRSFARHNQYQEFWKLKTGDSPATIMMTKGCPFNCDFCSKPIFGNKLRKRSVSDCINEILYIKSLGYSQLWIADDCFTLDNRFLNNFCLEMIEKKVNMTWSCLSRVDSMRDESAELMRNAGCVKIYLGVESGSDETLSLMKKHFKVKDASIMVKRMNKANIKIGAFFIVGYPGETIDSINETFKFSLSLPFDEISFTVPYPLPGSSLYHKIKGLNSYDDWDFENENKFIFKSQFDEPWLKNKIKNVLSEFKNRRILKK
ncbi:MAG: B12-binding domain-containing radical SAM protein [Actinobacteria bacterium]|nr:B12-binding domain-containing radical SAM protein [Actinomycetota bacterium]